MKQTFTARDTGPSKLGFTQPAMPELGDFEKFTATQKFLGNGVATGMGYGVNTSRIPISSRQTAPGWYQFKALSTSSSGGAARGTDKAPMKFGSTSVSGLSGFGFPRVLNLGFARQRVKS